MNSKNWLVPIFFLLSEWNDESRNHHTLLDEEKDANVTNENKTPSWLSLARIQGLRERVLQLFGKEVALVPSGEFVEFTKNLIPIFLIESRRLKTECI